MNNINFKAILSKNAKSIMRNDIDNDYTEYSKLAINLNNTLIETLEDNENLVITTRLNDFDMDELDIIRKDIKKENYHFPDILNMGNLINIQSMPSEIYKNNAFTSDIPFIIPVQNSGIAYLINDKYKKEITHQLEQTVINMISALPDGLVKITLIDKTGSGQNFPLLGMLGEKFMDGKILGENDIIERELESLKNDMGNVAQSISANGYSSIEDYNINTNEVEKRHHFVVIQDFPAGFNKKSSENILALIKSGKNAGISVFMTSTFNEIEKLREQINGIPLGSFLNQMTTLEFTDRPHPYMKEGLIKNNVEVITFPLRNEDNFKKLVNSTFKINLKEESKAQLESKIRYLNKKIEKINLKPMILLESIIPDESEWYSKTAGKGISVPFGKKGIETTSVNLGVNELDEQENVHHGLVCGRTGSGKTVLIHDIIMMSSIYYSPRELQFYLLDYKEGTEFALYKDFPQIKILSMESEIEFGHEVLESANKLIEERGNLFKSVDAQNLVGYNERVDEDHKLPRIIIIIDEFQKLLPPDNQRHSSKTNNLLQDILKRGRSFGINLILATQTLQDVDLQKSTLANMPLRIGLEMDEASATKIFGDNNSAPKFLTNPGEGIYNNKGGLAKNNMHFQACNIEDHRLIKLMDRVHTFMKEKLSIEEYHELVDSRFIYNGEKEGNYFNLIGNENKNNIYIGEPIGLDIEHTFINFKNDFAENVAMVGGNQLQAISTILYMTEQLLKNDEESTVYLNNFSLPLEKMFEIETNKFDNERFFLGKNSDSKDSVEKVYKEFQRRLENKILNDKKIYLVLFLIENAKVLREGRTEARKALDEMILSASEYGIHIIFYAIDYGTVRDQGLISELNKFKNKIVFKGGNSEKILTDATKVKFSDSDLIALMEKEYSEVIKFKPYINNKIKDYLKEEE